MSRGPGTLQRRMLEALATYQRLGADLQWKWTGGRRYALASYATDSDIRAYENGRRVPVWILRRDLDCDRAHLSRALKQLELRGLVYRAAGDLDVIGVMGRTCKFATLTSAGETWLSANKSELSGNKSNLQKLPLRAAFGHEAQPAATAATNIRL